MGLLAYPRSLVLRIRIHTFFRDQSLYLRRKLPILEPHPPSTPSTLFLFLFSLVVEALIAQVPSLTGPNVFPLFVKWIFFLYERVNCELFEVVLGEQDSWVVFLKDVMEQQ